MTRNNRRITLCPDCHTRFYPALKQRQDLAQTVSTGICSHCTRSGLVRRYVVEDPEAMPFPEARLISGKELAQILEKGMPFPEVQILSGTEFAKILKDGEVRK